MRAGACAVQQTLTSEAASVLKHSLSLARRRGHAQVTPLHVAATLLSSRASLLRRACLKSQQHQQPPPHIIQTSSHHPLQCRALELCFNVALNRLPTTPTPLLHNQPSLSNALVAALKRAQAHQRRGCIEQQQQQQQPLMAIKVELEQLIISILDDPSVSRVMREAGFSSTAVKSNLEDSSSASAVFQCYNSSGGGIYSSPCSPSHTPESNYLRDGINPSSFWQTHFLNFPSEQNPFFFSPQKRISSNPTIAPDSAKEDLKLVLEVLLRKKRKNTVIVGDSVSTAESLIAELKGRVEREEVPEELKSVKFIKFQFSPVSLRFMKREDVEMNLADLRRKVEGFASGGGGAIIYTGDLKWTVEATNGERDGEVVLGYNPVDCIVVEIGRLLSEYSKVWLMGIANYQTYIKCQIRQPPLEIQWALQAVSVPSGGLGLSLHASSLSWSQDKLSCCAECTFNYENEVSLVKSANHKSCSFDLDKSSSRLPYWLHPPEARLKENLAELRSKWNRLCHAMHQGRPAQDQFSTPIFKKQGSLGKNYSFNTSYPWWSNQNGVSDDNSNSLSFADSNHGFASFPVFRRQQSCTIQFSFTDETSKRQVVEPSLDSLKNTEGKEVKITLALGNCNFADSKSLPKLNRESHIHRGDICKVLQENVYWQRENIIPIVDALLNSTTAKERWVLIRGNDSVGKRRLALAIAKFIFGSTDLLFHMDMKKRDNEMVSSCCEMLAGALRSHKELVVLVEDVDFADPHFVRFLADRFEAEDIHKKSQGKENLSQKIFILTTSDSSTNVADRKRSLMQLKLEIQETTQSNSAPPGYEHKRKAEWDLQNNTKNLKIDEKQDCASNCSRKKEFSRQSSSNTLDLNVRAEEDDEESDKSFQASPISSDLTRELGIDPQNGFLELIKNNFVFDWNCDLKGEMRDRLLSRMSKSFEEVYGEGKYKEEVCFSVDEMAIEEVLVGSSFFLEDLFETWLKEVFQTSLKQTVKTGRKAGGILVRLCLAITDKSSLLESEEEGFMGSNLPNKINVVDFKG
ncbi:Clp, repeat (R) domain [Dillenia turbinata]|uniref:Clp, repeat (R) domain n=1 Tax=Dillenia turbinata TaxID=194707 RepID=A0AAN8ZLL2_9MAGN